MPLQLVVPILLLLGAPAQPAGSADELHDSFNELLARFVSAEGVDYDAWSGDAGAVERLSDYVDGLEELSPSEMARDEALAYWINLYNAVTVELVLEHYPVDSIKDTAGLLSSPWKKKLVTVQREELSLDAIEHEIIRPQFQDARIHFALNCASVGCPPLAPRAFAAQSLDAQLDAVCRTILNDERWVSMTEEKIELSKIFDWYREDFEQDAGSALAFIARHRADGEAFLRRAESLKIEYLDYDWSLNRAP